jgi:hypothetical protein
MTSERNPGRGLTAGKRGERAAAHGMPPPHHQAWTQRRIDAEFAVICAWIELRASVSRLAATLRDYTDGVRSRYGRT